MLQRRTLTENANYSVRWCVTKYANPEAFAQGVPYEVKVVHGNLLLNEGITELLMLLTGGTATPFDSAHAYLGVGDSTTAASAAQTGLQAATNKLYKAVSSGYPTVDGQTVTFRAVFNADEANFAWEELTVANGNSDSAVNLNRKVVSMGTKVNPAVWTLELQITFA